MNRDIRKITDGAMMAALIGAVLLLDRQLAGTLSGTVLFLFPLPMVFFSAKYGLKDSLPVLAAVFLLLFILGTPESIFFVGCAAVIGMIYGTGVYRGTDSRRLLFITMLLGAVMEMLSVAVGAALFGITLADNVAYLKEELTQITQMSGIAMPPQYESAGFLSSMFMFSTMLLGALEGAVTHLLSRIMLRRLRIKVTDVRPMRRYEPEKWHGYLALGCTVGYYASMTGYIGFEPAAVFLQGAGIVSIFYLLRYGFSGMGAVMKKLVPQFPAARIILPLLFLFFSPLTLMVAGFLYITTDLRENLRKGENDASGNQ